VVEGRDLVIATHGRSFYVLDDITPLRQWTAEVAAAEVHLFRPSEAVRRAYPAVIDYYHRDPNVRVKLDIVDSSGRLVRRLLDGPATRPFLHRTTWDLRYEGATTFPGIVLEGGNPSRGPWAPPGRYGVRLEIGGRVMTAPLVVTRDPRLRGTTDADLRAQFALAMRIRDRESAANGAVIRIRSLRQELGKRLDQANDVELTKTARPFFDQLTAIEGEIYQIRNQSSKDKIAFPIKVNDRLTGLRSSLEQGDGRPPAAYEKVFRELSRELEVYLARLAELLRNELPRLNRLIEKRGLEPVRAP
jgi:hypothetical protein